jgi:hypothetical protein
LYVRPAPIANNILTVFYTKYATIPSADTDLIAIENYDPFIVSFATAYTFACMEEKEASDLWTAVATATNTPLSLIEKMRQIYEVSGRVNNIS